MMVDTTNIIHHNIVSDKINILALDYAQSGREETFSKLFNEMKPLIIRQAKFDADKAQRYGVTIPVEDFESYFSMCVWTAAKGYNGTTDFVQRFYFFLRNRYLPNVWRNYQTIGNERDKNYRRYDKNRSDSLEMQIFEGLTLGELIPDKTDIENEVVERQSMLEIINGFKKVNERYHFVILLLYQGYSNADIAKTFGESSYNDKMRQLICRTKKAFKKYLNELSVLLSINGLSQIFINNIGVDKIKTTDMVIYRTVKNIYQNVC